MPVLLLYIDEEYERIAYEVTYYHHEKWNGSGYPTGKKADEIPLCARVMAIADVLMHYLPADVIKSQCP